MKKSSLSWIVLTLAFSLSACSSSSKDTEQASETLTPESQIADSSAPAIETPAQAEESAAEETHTETSTSPEMPLVWGYSGVIGPDMWHKLDPSFKVCATGKLQSPIDLKWSRPKENGEVNFSYRSGPVTLIDNGHSLEVKFPAGSAALIHGEEYQLKSLTFRSSSEHTLSGNSLPMEAQFIHENTQGQQAIVSVILIEGQFNSALKQLWDQWPAKKFKETTGSDLEFQPQALIPSIKTHYSYMGSLTTPPCTEGVHWIVLNTPIEISRDQIVAFREHYSSNNRPVQKLNGRKVSNF